MFIVIASLKNGDVLYFGPFRSVKRAMEYGKSCNELNNLARWFVKPIVSPFNGDRMVEKPRYKCRFLNLGVIKGQCLAAGIVRLDNHKRLGVPNGKPTITSRVLRIDFEKKEMETYNSIYWWENE